MTHTLSISNFKISANAFFAEIEHPKHRTYNEAPHTDPISPTS